MELNRKSETGKTPRRKQRFFRENGFWYFCTREGVSVGPFDRINMAVAGSREYIQCVKQTPELEKVIQNYA